MDFIPIPREPFVFTCEHAPIRPNSYYNDKYYKRWDTRKYSKSKVQNDQN